MISNPDSTGTPDGELQRNAEAIFELYPLKVGRPAALRAIKRTLRRHSFDIVRRKTIEFATVVANSDMRFTPSPTRFFREERFLDDPATWIRPAQPRAHAGIAPPRTFTDLNYAQSADVLRPGCQTETPVTTCYEMAPST